MAKFHYRDPNFGAKMRPTNGTPKMGSEVCWGQSGRVMPSNLSGMGEIAGTNACAYLIRHSSKLAAAFGHHAPSARDSPRTQDLLASALQTCSPIDVEAGGPISSSDAWNRAVHVYLHPHNAAASSQTIQSRDILLCHSFGGRRCSPSVHVADEIMSIAVSKKSRCFSMDSRARLLQPSQCLDRFAQVQIFGKLRYVFIGRIAPKRTPFSASVELNGHGCIAPGEYVDGQQHETLSGRKSSISLPLRRLTS